MNDKPLNSPPPGITEAVAVPHRKWRLPMVWLVPIVAALVGVWILVHSVRERGPAITIAFKTANGIEAGKTEIKYKDVVVGKVTDVTLADDRSRVLVKAQMKREAKGLLRDDTKFWVVTAKVTAGSVSGLGTLLSGAYLGIEPGKSETFRNSFTGQETAPVVLADVPGRYFILHAATLGSLNVNSPVYFRQINVGAVTNFQLDKDGHSVTANIFITEPYCQFVTTETRFWNASGLDLTLGAGGVSLQMPSIVSLLIGGIAFDSPVDAPAAEPAREGAAFPLFSNRDQALKQPDGTPVTFLLVFHQSARGLAVGAPVDLLGVTIGDVVSVNMDFNPATKLMEVPVEIRIYPNRLSWRQRMVKAGGTPPDPKTVVNDMIARGLRAQLRSGSLVTGQLYVSCDFFPAAPKASVDWNHKPPILPTVQGTVQQLEQTVTRIAAKMDKLPLDEIGEELRKTLEGTDKLVRRLDTEMMPEVNKTLAELKKTLADADKLVQRIDTDVTPEVRGAIAEARRSLSPDSQLQLDVRSALHEVSQAARALHTLTDYLDRHPESLLRGKGEQPPVSSEAKSPNPEKEQKK